MFDVPILLLAFNRPQTTQEVFNSIQKIQPSQLFVAIDGPRSQKSGEDELCREVIEIASQVNWTCDVKHLIRKENLGCKKAVSQAITWFFKEVDYGIILEDDCVPNTAFFTFCQSMLHRYSNNNRIMSISGNNYTGVHSDGGYYYSNIPHIWGWATWKRAWDKYDIKLQDLELLRHRLNSNNIFKSSLERTFWLSQFEKMKHPNSSTWDYQWTYSILVNNGLSITPHQNLVQNIGFIEESTHTNTDEMNLGQIIAENTIDLLQPSAFEASKNGDNRWFKRVVNWRVKLKVMLKLLLQY